MIPESFKPKYSKVRIIINCTEFPIEIPAGIDNRVYTYSHYKKGFTAKVLIGCTPNGLITFKSACAGGRKSDSQITIESGLLDLLENDDVILADKGFPEIRTQINEKGKKILVVMPPFLTNPEFTKEENEETYSVANVRIHIKRIMQRIKLYNILNEIPANLFYYIDDILHVCCVLVNYLQPPIIAAKKCKKNVKKCKKKQVFVKIPLKNPRLAPNAIPKNCMNKEDNTMILDTAENIKHENVLRDITDQSTVSQNQDFALSRNIRIETEAENENLLYAESLTTASEVAVIILANVKLNKN